jgi:flagellar motility protein MotE (MotC chaperone)
MSARVIGSAGFLAIALFAGSAAVAQQATQPPTPPAAAYTATINQLGAFAQPGKGNDQAQAAKLAKQYAKAEKEDEKKEIRKKMSDLLANQFDQHVEQQKKELDALEKQIASLKDTLKKRVDGKNDIVNRRLEQLILEAQGLGWSVPAMQRSSTVTIDPAATKNKK